jgi:hypothetical protein
MSDEITPPVLNNPLDIPLISEEHIKETAMALSDLIKEDGFDKKDIGDYVISEVYDFYDEERADELNATLLALIPGGVIRIGFVPVPMAVIKVGLAKVLDKVTPQVPLRLIVEILRKAGLTSV